MLMIYRILTLLQLANMLFRKRFSHITGQKKSLSNQYWIRTILTVVPPYFADYLCIQPHSICVFTDLCTITCARRHSLLSKTLIILIVYHFGVQLQDVFILHSFMRLSSTGSFLYGCVDHYFFFSKPLWYLYIIFLSVLKTNWFRVFCQYAFANYLPKTASTLRQ